MSFFFVNLGTAGHYFGGRAVLSKFGERFPSQGTVFHWLTGQLPLLVLVLVGINWQIAQNA